MNSLLGQLHLDSLGAETSFKEIVYAGEAK